MSYRQAVLRDDPIAFWPLDGGQGVRTYASLLLEYPTYQDFLDNEPTYNSEVGSVFLEDASNFRNHIAFSFGSPNFQDTLTLISHSSYNTNTAGFKVSSDVGISAINSYNAFQQGYENKTFAIEFIALFAGPSTSDIELLNLKDNTNKRMRIYANKDFLYFQAQLSDGSSVTTKKQISSWDTPIHVFATSKDRSIQIFANSISDEIVNIGASKYFYNNTDSFFSIGPTNSGQSFTINGLAFYDRILSVDEIKAHMFWAQRDSNPVQYSNQSNVSHFTFSPDSGNLILSKKFYTPSSYSQGTFSNIITDKSGLTISQTTSAGTATGVWTYPILISSYTDFAGIQLSWESGLPVASSGSDRRVSVQVSYDYGATYYDVINGKAMPYFINLHKTDLAVQCLIKVTLYSPDTSLTKQPRIDNLNINVYGSISNTSDSGLFQISPTTNSTYIIKRDDFNILFRSSNLGVLFSSQESGSQPGSATIKSINGSSYQSIEFWFKYNGSGTAVLDTGGTGQDLYIDSSNILHNISGSTLYVNGVSRNASPITLTSGEVYHVFLVYPSSKTHDILLNGSYDGSKTPSEASYGYITVYPSTTTSSQVQDRYLSFISVNTKTVNDTITSMGSLLEYTGSYSQANNGEPISFYRHIY
jgi:hypothetical protein